MQEFTRTLTREINVGGERLAVTLSKEGLSVRSVGSRRPPHNLSWEACLCACVAGGGQQPTAEQVGQALEAVRAGGPQTGEGVSGATPRRSRPRKEPAPESAAELAAPAPSTATDRMTILLARLDQWLNEHRERFQQALRPGATAADCDALATALGTALPEELRALLTWHNGQNPDVPGAFEQSWMLMSTEDIANAKKELDAEAHEGWQKTFLPFLDDDNGNYLCLDLASPDRPVRECWRGRADHALAAPSLLAWLENFVAALEAGKYAEDSERGNLMRHS
jgi:cell wall assembly regulator SMI1